MKTVASAPWGIVLLALMFAVLGTEVRGQEKTEAATRQYNAAVALQNRGAFDQAADEWTKFINAYKTDPRMDRALHYLGVCHLKANKLDLAQQCFDTVVKTYPKCDLLDATHLYLGVTQYNLAQAGKAEMYDAAADAFNTVITKHPESKHVAEALFYRGECFYHRGKKAEAAAMYSQLTAKFPNDKLMADALYALGVAQEELGRPAEAGKSYALFLKNFAESPLAAEVTVRQAAALSQLKQYAEAAALYASVPAKWPQSKLLAVANLAGGKCYYLAGNFAEARKLLGQALAAGGESTGEAAHWLVRSLLKEGKPAEAAAAAEKLLPKVGDGPQAAQLLLDQADAVYEVPERRGDAAALYAALAAKYPQEPTTPQALYMAGFMALGKADYQTALKHAMAFMTAYPNHELSADANYVAAESRLQLGRFADAEKLFAQLVQKYPSHTDVEAWKVRRGLSLYLQKKYAETVALLQPMLTELRTPDALAEAQYLLGGSQVEQKQFDAAVKSLEASLTAQPKWRQADETLLLLAQAYNAQQKARQAKAALSRLIAEFPASRLLDRAHYRLGEYAFATADYPAAAAEYQLVVEKWPAGTLAPHALYGLGWAKLNQNDHAGAEKTFDSLVQKYPDHKLVPRARYGRAMARYQLKNFAQAVDDAQALLAADPTPVEKSDARYLLGLCQAALQKHADAAATFQTLLKDDPKYAGADKVRYELAWALKQQEKEKESADAFTQLAAQSPDSPLAAEAQYHVGEFAYKSGEFKNAAAAYYASLQKAGKTELGEKAAHKLAWSYFRIDDLADARQTFSYQRATWPNGPLAADAAFMEAECLFKQKKFDEALAAYGQVKNPAGKDFQVLALLHAGQAAGQLKQWDKSLQWLDACVAQFPDSSYLPEALCEQGWAKQNLGKTDEALALYEKVIGKTNREVAARAQFMIGEIQFQQKNHAEAVKSFFKVSYGYGYPQWQADATYQAGRCFEALNNKEQAIKQYRELIEKYPQSDKTTLARQRIEELRK